VPVEGGNATLRRADRWLRQRVLQLRFPGSHAYWEQRYRLGGDSGAGSYGAFAAYKAEFLNSFVQEHDIGTVIELGCGDGHQLTLATYPQYIGLDVSPAAVERCTARFAGDRSKSFFAYSPAHFVDHARVFQADLALSADVLYHLVEDDVFERYLRQLFAAADRYVVIYASNEEVRDAARHVRHRRFTPWIEHNLPDWQLVETAPNPVPSAVAQFFVFARGVG
jgi:trans-aconitate methyltransferase